MSAVALSQQSWTVRDCSVGLRTVPYSLRASTRARYPRMSIGPDTGLVITIPPKYPEALLARFPNRVRNSDRVAHLPNRGSARDSGLSRPQAWRRPHLAIPVIMC